MNSGFFRRLYRIRTLTALVLCLPGVLLGLWYAWGAFSRFDQYRRSTGEEVPLTVDSFHLYLFDLLRHDLRRMVLRPGPFSSSFEHLTLHIDTEDLHALYGGAELESKRPYVDVLFEPGRLKPGERLIPAEVRLRGQKHWHLLGKQKSLKVRLPKGVLHRGNRVFNLINDPDPMVVGEQVIMDLLRREGVLTPVSDFVRLRMNKTDLGVYRYVTQPDEAVLRNHGRIPGNMYSGNLPPSAASHALWTDASSWKRVASRGDGEGKKKRADIKRLITMINDASLEEFEDFVRHEVDLKAFAAFDALDVAFACNQHDYRENHKLYFDPYRGRWEPVAWNFRGFQGGRSFNEVEHPLLLRLKLVPEYLSLRNGILYDFLTGKGSPSAIHSRGTALLKKLAPEFNTDPLWDAYHLLPRLDDFQRQMVRPMDMERAVLVFESELTTYRKRHAFLVRELEENPVYVHTGEGDGSEATGVEVIIDGRVGARLTSFLAKWPEECNSPEWQVFREGAPVTARSTDGRAELELPETLLPTIRIKAHPDPSPEGGSVMSEMAPVSYDYTIVSPCRPDEVSVEGIHLATNARVRSREAPPDLLARLQLQVEALSPEDVPRLVPGETGPPSRVSPHPAETVSLGPGTVRVTGTRVFPLDQQVRIAPGTTLLMGEGASLVFLGPVMAKGTRSAPIRVAKGSAEAWGGIALQGKGTRGSQLEYVEVSGGSVPEWRLASFPGMVNVHDTEQITLRNCTFSDNEGDGDMVHAAYVEDLKIEDSSARGASADALDIEFSSGILRRMDIAGAGDDGLDLMGARVEFSDSVIAGAAGNGISIGEESEVTVRNALVASGGVGVLVKNASRAYLYGSMLFGNGTGVEVYQRTVRFEGENRVTADVLFVVESLKKSIDRKDRARDDLDLGRIQTHLPRGDSLASLKNDVLELSQWDDLPRWLAGPGGRKGR